MARIPTEDGGFMLDSEQSAPWDLIEFFPWTHLPLQKQLVAQLAGVMGVKSKHPRHHYITISVDVKASEEEREAAISQGMKELEEICHHQYRGRANGIASQLP